MHRNSLICKHIAKVINEKKTFWLKLHLSIQEKYFKIGSGLIQK